VADSFPGFSLDIFGNEALSVAEIDFIPNEDTNFSIKLDSPYNFNLAVVGMDERFTRSFEGFTPVLALHEDFGLVLTFRDQVMGFERIGFKVCVTKRRAGMDCRTFADF